MNPVQREEPEEIAKLGAISRCIHRVGKRADVFGEWQVCQADPRFHQVVGTQAGEGFPDQIDEFGPGHQAVDPFGDPGAAGPLAIGRRRFAAETFGRLEKGSVPILTPVPIAAVGPIHEEPCLLGAGHEDLRMQGKVEIQTGGAGLRGADHDEVGKASLGRRFSRRLTLWVLRRHRECFHDSLRGLRQRRPCASLSPRSEGAARGRQSCGPPREAPSECGG